MECTESLTRVLEILVVIIDEKSNNTSYLTQKNSNSLGENINHTFKCKSQTKLPLRGISENFINIISVVLKLAFSYYSRYEYS